MGRSIFAIDSLLPPIRSVHERYVLVPPNKTLKVDGSQDFRIIFFLEGNMELRLSSGPTILINKGDAISTDLPVIRYYRSTRPGEEVRNHVVVLQLATGSRRRRKKTAPHDPMALLEDQLVRQLSGFHHFPNALDRGGGWEIRQEIRREAEKRKDASRWKISGLALALLSLLLDDAPKESSPSSVDRGAAAVQHARQFIMENFRENLSLTRIAWEVRLSGEHLERLFRKHAGLTVFRFVEQIRIEKAQQMLLMTDLPVVAIASRCGFSSSNLLCRHFKASTRMTPLQYRLHARTYEKFSPSQLQPT